MSRRDFENSSESTTSSPRSHLLSIEPDLGQASQSRNAIERELTPPSSVASSQEISEDVPAAGKKRTADGEVKAKGHSRNLSTLSQASTGSVAELSESLKTKLSYAMVKVQNGWQNLSLEQVESLASSSPRSPQTILSPRSTMAAIHESNDMINGFVPASAIPSSSSTKGLAPPATIISGARRRLVPNTPLQVNTARPSRPQVQQRTPSQNAAMEADAVETLLFMSASPNTSLSPRKMHNLPKYSRPRFETKTDFVNGVLDDLDLDGHEDLDQALSILEAHKATKLSA